MIDQEEALRELTEFVCDQGLWTEFEEKMKSKGYTEDEIEDIGQ